MGSAGHRRSEPTSRRRASGRGSSGRPCASSADGPWTSAAAPDAIRCSSRGSVDVVGIDASPTQVALARIRGVAQVFPGDARRVPRGLGTFRTVLMMGNNLGLPGSLPRMRRFLRDLKEFTPKGGRLIGNSVIPGTWSDDHLPYVKWNIRRGRPAGLLTLRGRYKKAIGDWLDLLLIPPEDLARLAHETGWDLVRVIREGGPGEYIGVLERH